MKIKQSIARMAAGALLMLSLPLSGVLASTSTAGFSDVPPTNPNYAAIMDLQARGIISGYPDGTFKPDQVVNRVEALKIILLGANIPVPQNTGTGGFSDTQPNEWYAMYLLKAKELAIVSGYPDGTFKPTQTVNLVENLKMLINAHKIDLSNVVLAGNLFADTPADQWYAKFVAYAKINLWISGDAKNMVYPAQGMTRGKLAQVLYNSIHNQGGTQQTTPPPSPPSNPQLVDLNVTIENYMFNKSTMTIAQGTRVRWTNKDSVAHTVTSDDGKFDSKDIAPGGTFDFTFNDLGTFNYHCAHHLNMTGTITVKPAIEVPTV